MLILLHIQHQVQLSAHPIPSGFRAVYESPISGDGQEVDSESLSKPQVWEGCFFTYLDNNGDLRVNAGDLIWIFKDSDADGIDDVTSRCEFKILDSLDNEVLTKQF